MTFGEDWGWGASKQESRSIYDVFLAAGGNFIDTANLYTNGTSEDFLGEFTRASCNQLGPAAERGRHSDHWCTKPGTGPRQPGRLSGTSIFS